jgi:GAF domain-containing protein
MTINKQQRYEEMLPQLASLIAGETEEMSVLANVAAVIHETFGFWWTGFYLVRGGELRLGPFQGPVACMHIQRGRGVCGTSWERSETIVVPDVELFPGHIACSSASRSEIVVPLYNINKVVVGVLDIDSRELSTFDTTDKHYLEQICTLLGRI